MGVAVLLPTLASAEGASPWLPIPGQFSLSVIHTEQSGKNAYIGSAKVPISAVTQGGANAFKRSTSSLRFDYGIFDSLSVDATLGYGQVKAGAADSDRGLSDSTVGLNWRVLDEYERPGWPTLTLRAAGIIAGNYDSARLAALGNGQSGLDLSVLVGKQLVPALAVWAEVGVQNRKGSVPNATYYELGTRVRFGGIWNASLAYANKQYGGTLDIGGPGFSPAAFQDVKAERSVVKLGTGVSFAQNQGVGLTLARVVAGRNTVKDDTAVSLAYTIGF